MNNIGKNSFDIGRMDALAAGDSLLHRLDPRAKLITTLVFIVAVVSFDKYALSAILPFFLYPIALISLGGLPYNYLLKKVLIVSPFAILIGVFNPLLDREILFHIGSVGISGGFVSFLSILLRFVLTVTAALILISLTGFNAVCESMRKFGVPKPFIVQLLFFYRYLFVMTDEADRMVRARSLRTFNSGTMSFRIFISLIGHLLLRTLDRAERIYRAMCCRGFDGHFYLIRSMKIRVPEIIFMSGWVSLFVLFRCTNVPLHLGTLITGIVP
ncbi:MAG: cobalt ECF transporter T component CbiQ [Thermodesulfobacteriota bacterium]|nr:MAG: cobalt ECF transporter T component CbiQ [Thermodesulfobacteriota bacterium]